MRILLFVLKYMHISLLLKMINGFSWQAKIMASPFNVCNRMVPTQIRQITGHQEIVDVVISDRVVTQFIHIAHAHIN